MEKTSPPPILQLSPTGDGVSSALELAWELEKLEKLAIGVDHRERYFVLRTYVISNFYRCS